MAIQILPGRKENARLIAKAITMAIGDNLVSVLAGKDHTADDVMTLFESLACRTDTQYSYLNTLVAVDDYGTVAGIIIAYDGAELYRLREAFFEEAEKTIALRPEEGMADETGPEEFYIDTLAVFPEYRGQRIGSDLIAAACERARTINKPVGLLVSKDNTTARRLYESLGFVKVGKRPFAGEMMDHLVKE